MINLTKQELLDINGGCLKLGVGLIIGAAISFIIGVIDGQIKLK